MKMLPINMWPRFSTAWNEPVSNKYPCGHSRRVVSHGPTAKKMSGCLRRHARLFAAPAGPGLGLLCAQQEEDVGLASVQSRAAQIRGRRAFGRRWQSQGRPIRGAAEGRNARHATSASAPCRPNPSAQTAKNSRAIAGQEARASQETRAGYSRKKVHAKTEGDSEEAS